jgi:hypothetical protein
MKIPFLIYTAAVVFPSFALATTLLWPVPQSMEVGKLELNLDVCTSMHLFLFVYTKINIYFI